MPGPYRGARRRGLPGTHICVPYNPSGNVRRGGIYAARAVCGGGNLRGGVKTSPYDVEG